MGERMASMTVRSAAALDAEFAQDGFHQAPLGQSALQQIQTHKSGESQPPLIHKNRAGLHAQSQRQQDKKASDQTNDLPRFHDDLLQLMKEKKVKRHTFYGTPRNTESG
jgi:hypothetical protein